MNKKVLIIAYCYPPANNGGVERPYRFAKYLPEYGYDPIVITTNAYGVIEGETNVLRFWDLAGQNEKKTNRILIFFLKALRKLIIDAGIFLERDLFWYISARKNINRFILRNKIDVVFCTYPTIGSMLLGIHLKRKSKTALVVDFRDGLLFEGLQEFNRIRKFSAEKLERKIVENADFITTVSPPITNYFKQKYKVQNVATIYNGFDEQELNGIKDTHQPKLQTKPFVIKYFGRFGKSSKTCDPTNLFNAVSLLKEKRFLNPKNFSLVMFTDLLNSELGLIRKFGISDIVTINPIINRELALREMKCCNFLLFHGDAHRTSVVSTKLLEYIFMRKPILGICKGNEAEKIIERTSTGIVIGFEVDEIIEGFKKALNYDLRDFNPNSSEIRKFTRRILTRELANVFNKYTLAHLMTDV